MDYKRKSILDLNAYCQLEIIEYIIADCEMRDSSRNKMKYADLINFALAHENLEAISEEYYYDLDESLQLVFVANREELEIDFSELETKFTGKVGDAFWRTYVDAIRQNNVVSAVDLQYAPESFQPNFLDHFKMIKLALENKKSLHKVTIRLNGYSLEDLNNFGHITHLDLDVRMSSEALVEVCKSNPQLHTLCFRSTEILGRLSDIAPYCSNLTNLEFAAKQDNDRVEYAPLAELPNLKKMTIHGAYENGSFLNIFKAITNWKRIQPFKITFSDVLRDLRRFMRDLRFIARTNSVLLLVMESCGKGIQLSVSYDFWDISGDSRPLENSLALIEAELKIDDESYALKPITHLICTFSGWEHFESLSALTNLEIVNVTVETNYDINYSKAFCSLINTCSARGVIQCFDWCIQFRKIESIISQSKRSTALEIQAKEEALSRIFEAFRSYRDLITIEELVCISCDNKRIKFVLKMAEVHPIKKLRISLANTSDIKYLSDLAELGALEELELYFSVKGSLIKLFKQMALKASPSLQCLTICSNDLSSEELVQVSKISSLKKLDLDLCDSELKDCESLMKLANLNIEELTLATPQFPLQKLFSAFAVKTTTRLQHLKITETPKRYLKICELEELSKIKSLKKLNLSFLKEVKGNLTNLCELSELESLQFKFKYMELNYADVMNFVLSFLKCCRNLDCLTIDCGMFGLGNMNDLYSILKSIRDPTHQSPLTVNCINIFRHILFDLNIIKLNHDKSKGILVTENAYMKVFLFSD